MTLVSMMAVRGLVAAVERAGVERARFLADVGLTQALLDDALARLPLAEYGRVLRAALAASGDPALGLHMGEHVDASGFDVLGPMGDHSASLRAALQMAGRYARIVTEGPRLELQESAELATVRFTRLRGDAPEVRVTAEFVTAALLSLLRRFVGGRAQPLRVCFAYPAPPYRAEYARIFAGREQFGADFTGLELERAWLDRTQVDRSPELYALLETRAELLLARVDQGAPVAERVKRWLAAQNGPSKPTMDTIARALGMSARSLRRRLREERTQFAELIEQAQAARAKRMLADPRRSVQETAYALGFGTPAAFSRAFRRWTGTTPSAYRSAR